MWWRAAPLYTVAAMSIRESFGASFEAGFELPIWYRHVLRCLVVVCQSSVTRGDF
jgi:hypothetical protein